MQLAPGLFDCRAMPFAVAVGLLKGGVGLLNGYLHFPGDLQAGAAIAEQDLVTAMLFAWPSRASD